MTLNASVYHKLVTFPPIFLLYYTYVKTFSLGMSHPAIILSIHLDVASSIHISAVIPR